MTAKLEIIIAKHRSRRIAAHGDALEGVDDPEKINIIINAWRDTEADRVLYAELMQAIESALLELEASMDRVEAQEK